MPQTRFDVLGIGNAIVDVISQADDAFLIRHDVPKGTMSLIDAERAEALYRAMGPGIEMSGGSAGNTVAGVAALGGRAAYVGKVRDDWLGKVFGHDIRAAGVRFETGMAKDGPPTARSLILVTPDAERSMNTYLGACVELGPDDVEPDAVAQSTITYLEGYLWDPEGGKAAFRKAARLAHLAGRRVALSLSDPFCVERYRDEFRAFVSDGVDILFANEEEIRSLFQVPTFDAALQALRGHCEIAVLTRGGHGSVVVAGDEVHVIDAEPVQRVVDTTGAGDLFAAGFLFGFTNGRSLADAARIGSLAAAEVISHYGARPEASLKALMEDREL
jgi:sugar/nucleoside kinase (ribokinase family)